MIEKNLINHPKNYFAKLKRALDLIDDKKLIRLITKIESVIGTNRTIFIAGNGGSAATSSHMVCDLSKTILGDNPKINNARLRVISLNENIPLMTAWSNDEGYEYIFAEQLRNLGRKNDYLILFTGSGNSPNIIEAVIAAKKLGIKTFGIFGFDGGEAKKIVDDYLLIDSDDYGVIEDAHSIINHLITDWLRKKIRNISAERKQKNIKSAFSKDAVYTKK